MKNHFLSIPPVITLVMLISLTFLSYLALTSQMIIIHDSIGYQKLAQMFTQSPWQEYFISGPNREPLYSLLISMAIRLDGSGSNYLSLTVLFQIIILLISQYLTFRLLKNMALSDVLIAVFLLYMGLSPAMVSSSLILFSEILTYPLILWMVLALSRSWVQLNCADTKRIALNALTFSFPALLMIFIKGAFEIITPAVLIPFLWRYINAAAQKERLTARNTLFFLLVVLATIYVPVTMYKFVNKHFNGVYALTDRGPEALYGSSARRMMPLTTERILSAFTYMSGPDVCSRTFAARCLHWSYQTSDELGASRSHELIDQGLNRNQINQTLVKESIPLILRNPAQYALLSIIEGGKILFWEAPEISFVVYPDAVDKIYNNRWFRYILRFFIAFLSATGLILGICKIWTNRDSILHPAPRDTGPHIYHFFICLTILCFALVHSIFFILPRYALVVAPLFLCLFAYEINLKLNKQKGQ